MHKANKPHLDESAILKAASLELELPARRRFLQQTLGLGSLTLLTGCSLNTEDSVEHMLQSMSKFNDRVQAALFDPHKLAPIYPESMMKRPFPFNAYYGRESIPRVEADSFSLRISGRASNKRSWSLRELYQLPQSSQVTRLICVEGWSAIGKWGGVPFSNFLQSIGADLSAKYIGFKCADDYYQSIDMASALHSQTLLALSYDGKILPPEYGFPMRLRIPTKLGYKNPKHITEIFITNDYPGGYWEDQGYNWFGGI